MLNFLLPFRQPLHYYPSAFCQAEREQSDMVENTVPFGIRKFRKFKPEFFGRMELGLSAIFKFVELDSNSEGGQFFLVVRQLYEQFPC